MTYIRLTISSCIYLQIKGSEAFEWFGHSLTFLDAAARIVAVGSPTLTDCSQGPAPVRDGATMRARGKGPFTYSVLFNQPLMGRWSVHLS